MQYPFYGSRQLMRHLRARASRRGGTGSDGSWQSWGWRRPTARTSVASPEHPYLLRGLSSRATCGAGPDARVFLPGGRDGLGDPARARVALVDGRVVLRRGAGRAPGGLPEILNTDQGSQFTSEAFADRVLGAGVSFSMDGRGRFLVFIERLWRSLKYESVYLHELRDGLDAERIIGSWIDFYNEVRPHGRAYAGRGQRQGGGVNDGSPHPAAARPREPAGPRSNRDLSIPGASRQWRPSPARRWGSPPGVRGSYWSLSFPGRERTAGSHPPQENQRESSRGLSQPLGIHLNLALGLSRRGRGSHGGRQAHSGGHVRGLPSSHPTMKAGYGCRESFRATPPLSTTGFPQRVTIWVRYASRSDRQGAGSGSSTATSTLGSWTNWMCRMS